MTGEDLKRLQDHMLEHAKTILLEDKHLSPMAFIVTLRENADKLVVGGWAEEAKRTSNVPVVDMGGIETAVIVILLTMTWEDRYRTLVKVDPQYRAMLEPLLEEATRVGVDDPHMRVMRAFMNVAEIEENDLVAAMLKNVCAEVNAYACITQSEAWFREAGSAEEAARARVHGLAGDEAAHEVIVSMMETHDFARGVTVRIEREASTNEKRDDGKVLGFGTQEESSKVSGRLANILKPVGIAS